MVQRGVCHRQKRDGRLDLQKLQTLERAIERDLSRLQGASIFSLLSPPSEGRLLRRPSGDSDGDGYVNAGEWTGIFPSMMGAFPYPAIALLFLY